MKDRLPIEVDQKLMERPDFQVLQTLQPNLNLLIFAGWIAYRVLHYITFPLEVFLRRDFGVRYIKPRKLVLLGVVILLGLLMRFSIPLCLFLLAALGFGSWHYLKAWQWFWAERPYRHSGLGGVPWGGGEYGFWEVLSSVRMGGFTPPLGNAWVMRLYEPLLCLVVGLLPAVMGSPLGYCVMVSALGLAIKAHVQFTNLRERWLDDMDALVISMASREHLKNVVAPENKPEKIVHTARVVGPKGSALPDMVELPPPKRKTRCPACRAVLGISASHAGGSLKCPSCRETLRIPVEVNA